jgi:hypothetical protein
VRLTTQVHEVHRGQVRHETGAALTREEPPATTPVEERGPGLQPPLVDALEDGG